MTLTLLGIFLPIVVTIAFACGAYVVRRSVWETKMEMWTRAIFRRLTMIEKHLGLLEGGDVIDEYPNDGRAQRNDHSDSGSGGKRNDSDHSHNQES